MKFPKALIFVLIFLLAVSSVFAGPPQQQPEVWRALAQRLEPGAFVRVRLLDRGQIKGYLLAVEGDSFQIKPKTRITVPIREVRFSEVESIERQRDGWSPGLKVVTGIGVAVAATFLLAIAALYSLD